MATMAESVRESLVGVTQEPQMSQQIRSNFLKNAKTDEKTGELYMTEEDFVNAIAPVHEDYVSDVAMIAPFESIAHTLY